MTARSPGFLPGSWSSCAASGSSRNPGSLTLAVGAWRCCRARELREGGGRVLGQTASPNRGPHRPPGGLHSHQGRSTAGKRSRRRSTFLRLAGLEQRKRRRQRTGIYRFIEVDAPSRTNRAAGCSVGLISTRPLLDLVVAHPGRGAANRDDHRAVLEALGSMNMASRSSARSISKLEDAVSGTVWSGIRFRFRTPVRH